MDFEKKMKRLEEIVGGLEGGKLPLEEAIKNFEEGVKVFKQCQKELSQAEEKVKKLIDINEKGEVLSEDFDEQFE